MERKRPHTGNKVGGQINIKAFGNIDHISDTALDQIDSQHFGLVFLSEGSPPFDRLA